MTGHKNVVDVSPSTLSTIYIVHTNVRVCMCVCVLGYIHISVLAFQSMYVFFPLGETCWHCLVLIITPNICNLQLKLRQEL